MAHTTFEAALARVLAHEGGYTDHPDDPGGPTNFGITIADFRRYVKPDASAADIRAMRLADAKAIYRTRYWDALRCDDLPAGLDYAVFDYGVNSGIGRASTVLQRLVGRSESGRIGDDEIAAVRGRDVQSLIAGLCDERLAFLKRLKTWPVFGAGWGRRVKEVRAAALAMAVAPPSVKPAPGVVPKAAAGVVVAAGAAAAHQAGARPGAIAAFVLLAIGVALAGWLAWRWYRVRRGAGRGLEEPA